MSFLASAVAELSTTRLGSLHLATAAQIDLASLGEPLETARTFPSVMLHMMLHVSLHMLPMLDSSEHSDPHFFPHSEFSTSEFSISEIYFFFHKMKPIRPIATSPTPITVGVKKDLVG
jgi:hypothetical protein